MNLPVEKFLSQKFIEIAKKHNFTIYANGIYCTDASFIDGPIYFDFVHSALPLVRNPFTREEVYEGFSVIQDHDGNGPHITISLFNRDKPNHDFWVLHDMCVCLETIDPSTLTMLFLDRKGHGMNGMPHDMKECYELVEKVIADARELIKELGTVIT